MRVLFTTVPLPGHFFPLVPLAWACRALGHEVLVATPANYVPAVLRAGLPATPNGPAADFVGLLPADSAGREQAERRFLHGRVFARIAARNLAGTESIVDFWRPDLVVVERAELAGRIAAATRGVRYAELHWGVAALREFDAAAAVQLAGELAVRGLTAVPRPDWVVNPWPPSLRRAYAAGHRGIRHVPYNGEARLPDWMWAARRRPRICLTLGTLLPRMDAEELPGMLLPLARRLGRLRVELVVAVDDEIVADWPPLPDAVRYAGRLPLAEVLRVCDVAVHHGGNGSSLTALEAGVPQLVLPHFDDQADNAAAVSAAGAGLRLTDGTGDPDSIAEHCRALLDAPRFAAAAGRVAAEIAAQPSPVDIAEWLLGNESTAREPGRAA